jgi:hypothetical protein
VKAFQRAGPAREGKIFSFTGPDGPGSIFFEFYGPGEREPVFSRGYNTLALIQVQIASRRAFTLINEIDQQLIARTNSLL